MTLFLSIGKTAYPRNPNFSGGDKLRRVHSKFTVPGTGTAGDQYILAGPISMDTRIARIFGKMPALTSVTGANLGFYYSKDNLATQANLVPVKVGGGAELWSAVSLATAATAYDDQLTLKNAALDNTKPIRDLFSPALGPDAEPVGGIYLVLTLPQANTAGGVMDLDVEFEEATTR